jgi:hypothetical protein
MEGLTVGRMVHYVAYGTPQGEFPQGKHRAAVVTEVGDNDKGIVSLCILNPGGIFFTVGTHYSEDTSIPGTWHWIEKV